MDDFKKKPQQRKGFWRGFLTGAVVIALAGGLFSQARATGFFGLTETNVLSDSRHQEKLKTLEGMIDKYYLEEKEEEELAEGIYTGLIYGLDDPYSRYYTAEEFEEAMKETQGSYVGIGALMSQSKDGVVTINECYEGSTAKEAGVQAGDLLLKVDGQDVQEMELTQIVALIREKEDQTVLLTIERDGKEQEIPVPVSEVELTYVTGEMLQDQTGYVKITEFADVSYKQYEKVMETLKEQGMKRLIIDLRDNPGGLMTSVCDILNEILPKGLIVYTEDKYGNREEEWADGENSFDYPLAVLVNENSASASEIFAGAVKDYQVGTLVGTTTYGKGIVQETRQLEDGSAIKLTTAKYYTPNGNNIHEVGIQPDVVSELSEEAREQAELTKEEDTQLQKAIEILLADPKG